MYGGRPHPSIKAEFLESKFPTLSSVNTRARRPGPLVGRRGEVELIRRARIKPNTRLSLQRHENPLAIRNEAKPVAFRKIEALRIRPEIGPQQESRKAVRRALPTTRTSANRGEQKTGTIALSSTIAVTSALPLSEPEAEAETRSAY
jgi:ribosomal protein S3